MAVGRRTEADGKRFSGGQTGTTSARAPMRTAASDCGASTWVAEGAYSLQLACTIAEQGPGTEQGPSRDPSLYHILYIAEQGPGTVEQGPSRDPLYTNYSGAGTSEGPSRDRLSLHIAEQGPGTEQGPPITIVQQ